jgi:glutamate-ammonia-ligase adenylyltransferase
MTKRPVTDLLLAEHLEPEEAAALLRPYGFSDFEKADANLQEMADEPRNRRLLAEFLGDLLSHLGESPDPDRALNTLERYTKAAVNRTNLYSYLKDSPRTVELLARTVWGSPFMADILIRDPELIYWLSDFRILNKKRLRADMTRDLSGALKYLKDENRKLDILRLFKRKEILRIGVRDLLRLADVEETVSELSALGEVLIDRAVEISEAAVRREFGGAPERRGFTVLGMGKLGGGELNFSSDVDLIYLYAADGAKTGRGGKTIDPHDFFGALSRRLTTALSDTTNEGILYRVDLRLRPEGDSGEMAYSLPAIRRYYAERGETWERMALLKTWPVGGDRKLGLKFIRAVEPFIYNRPFDGRARGEVRRIKERIDQKMELRGQSHLNVKLGFGGIREIEFLVQALQLSHGKQLPGIRERGTMKGLSALHRRKLISEEDYRSLSMAYRFLRDVENKLQMVYDSQVHSLPENPSELRDCAYRVGYRDAGGDSAADLLMRDYRTHTARVNAAFRRVFTEEKAPSAAPKRRSKINSPRRGRGGRSA